MTEECTSKDLMWIVGCLQCELESREIVIDRLKRHLFHENGLKVSEDPGEPLQALARDKFLWNEPQGTSTCSDSRLCRLENLIESQQDAQCKLKRHLQNLESNYSAALAELERYKKLESGSDSEVLNSLRKECTQLRLEIAEEQRKRTQLISDLKQLLRGWYEQKTVINKQKQVAVLILKERRHLLDQLMLDQQRISELEKALVLQRSNCSCPLTQDVGTCSQIHDAHDNIQNSDVSREVSPSSDYLLRFSLDDIQPKIELQPKLTSLCSRKTAVESSSSGMLSAEKNVCPNYHSNQPPRSKPNPPTRRSSEIKTTTSTAFSSYTDLSNAPKSIDVNSSFAVRSNSETAIPESLLIKLSSGSDSRSSTPSPPPPPPPPPVQLHFPYPGMLGHSSTSHYRNSARSQFLGTAHVHRQSGPVSPNWFFNSDNVNSGTSRSSQLSTFHQLSYPTSVFPNLSHSIVSRGTAPVKTACSDSAVQPSFRYHHIIQAQSTIKPIGFNSPSGSLLAELSNTSTSPSHIIPTYYVASSVSPVSSSSVVGSLRSLRTAVSISSTDLTGVSPTSETGHLCINGK